MGKRSENKEAKSQKKEQKDEKDKSERREPLDEDADNQGFTQWLRSSDGVDMMRLFVIANSLVIFVTMAWPSMQEIFSIVKEYILGEEDE